MNKERIKGIAIGFILCALFSASVVVFANTQTVVREITYGVRVNLNGGLLQFAEDSRPFVMDYRTFLPVRAIADELGLDVDFNDTTNTVYLRSGMPIALPPLHPPPEPPHSDIVENDFLTFGGTFTFNGLVVTLGNHAEVFDRGENALAVRLPVVITNNGGERMNLSTPIVYNPRGERLSVAGIAILFMMQGEGILAVIPEPGETVETHIHFDFDGDGVYILIFEPNIGGNIEVRLEVGSIPMPEPAPTLELTPAPAPIAPTLEPEATAQPAEGRLIFEDNNIRVTFAGTRIGGTSRSPREEIQFFVENRTVATLTFQADSMSINGQSLGHISGSERIAPHSSGVIRFRTAEDFPTMNPSTISGAINVIDFDRLLIPDGQISRRIAEITFTNVSVD